MPISSVFGSLGEWDSAQAELTDPTADGPRAVVNRALCDAAATSIAGSVINSLSGPAGPVIIPSFCRPYWEQNGDTGPTVQPPQIEGGQCVGVQYSVVVTWDRANGSVGSQTKIVEGPVGGPVFERANPYRVDLTKRDGTAVPFGDGSAGVLGSWRAVATPADGSPDVCPSLPPTVVPDPTYSNPRPVNQPTTVNIGGDSYDIVISDVQLDVTNKPYVKVTGPNFEVGVPLDQPREIQEPEVVEESDPIEPVEPTGEIPAPLAPNESLELFGVQWSLIDIPDGFGRIPGPEPLFFPRIVGTLQFRLLKPDGEFFYDAPVNLWTEKGTYVKTSPEFLIFGLRYNALPPLRLQVTPLFRPKRTR